MAAASPKRARLSAGDSPRPSHVCQLCNKAYERLDHLNRHLDSHRNERTFRCSRCPQGFNRRDLLLRHEASHEKHAASARAGLNRTRERAVRACDSCVVSKLKCDNSRPCLRCRKRKIACETKTDEGSSSYYNFDSSSAADEQEPRNDDRALLSPPETNTNDETSSSPTAQHANRPGTSEFAASTTVDNAATQTDHTGDQWPQDTFTTLSPFPIFFEQIMAPDFVSTTSPSCPPDLFNPLPDLDWFQDTTDIFGLDFTPTIDNALEFQFNLDDNGVVLQFSDQSGQIDETSNETSQNTAKQRHAIFQKSLWLWTPKSNQNAFSEQDSIPLNERQIDVSTSPQQPYLQAISLRDRLSQGTRDKILQMVIKTAKSNLSIPSFPSAECLDILLKVGIAKRLETDAWIHPYTFDYETTRPELLTALIAAGCVCFGIPRVNKTGLVLFEIVRVALNQLAEEDNSVIQDLQWMQACMLWIDVTAFCGYQRKMEIAESSLQPLVTALRRRGKFDHVAYHNTGPGVVIEGDELERKWKRWVEEESYKRLVYHLFEHDMNTTIVKERNPLISYAEMSLPLPASRDLWLAPSSEVWQLEYSTKGPGKALETSLRDLLANNDLLHALPSSIDSRVAQIGYLSGLAAQCWEHFQQSKVANSGFASMEDPSTKLWIQSRSQKLYQSLQGAKLNQNDCAAVTSLFTEFMMMLLHVSLDEVTRFAGKCGEKEAHRAYQVLQPWSKTKSARTAIFHAGQVVRIARQVPPFQLRGPDSLLIYHSIMVLWAYGMMQRDAERRQSQEKLPRIGSSDEQAPVFLDESASERTNAFLALNVGRPCLHMENGEGDTSQTCDVRSAQAVMSVGIAVLERNLPTETRENLPQLLRSLCELMSALGTLK